MKSIVLKILIMSAVSAALFSLPAFGAERLEDFAGLVQDIDAPAMSPEETQTDESLFESDQDQIIESEKETKKNTAKEKPPAVKEKPSVVKEKPSVVKEKPSVVKEKPSVVKEKTPVVKEKTPVKQRTAAKQKVSKKQSKETQELEKTPDTEEKTVDFKDKTQKVSLAKLHITAGATTRMEREVNVIPVRKRTPQTEEAANERLETDRLSEFADLAETYEDAGVDAMDETYDGMSDLSGYEDQSESERETLAAIYGRDEFMDMESEESRLAAFAELAGTR